MRFDCRREARGANVQLSNVTGIYSATAVAVEASGHINATTFHGHTLVRIAPGGFALQEGSRDLAMLVTLLPGAWTVQVAGPGSSSGIVLVEVYAVP